MIGENYRHTLANTMVKYGANVIEKHINKTVQALEEKLLQDAIGEGQAPGPIAIAQCLLQASLTEALARLLVDRIQYWAQRQYEHEPNPAAVEAAVKHINVAIKLIMDDALARKNGLVPGHN